MRRLLVSILLALLACAAGSGADARAAAEPRVTVISDSVMTSVLWHTENVAILADGVDLDMEVAVCRRLAGTSCVFEGAAPPTLLDLLPSLSNLGSTVVVEMGYNDVPATFRANVEQTIAQLTARGVTRIIWPTLNVSRPEFADMNRVLIDAMLAHPQLSIVDWDAYSEGHGDWFQTDNLHLMPAGGTGIATLVHAALAAPLVLPAQAALPAGGRGLAYQATLAGPAGGSWQLLSGSLPPGLRLGSDGSLAGRPTQAGTFSSELLFRSASFQLGNRHVEIRIAPAPAAKVHTTAKAKQRKSRHPLVARRIAAHQGPR
jgi:hypothetical protein